MLEKKLKIEPKLKALAIFERGKCFSSSVQSDICIQANASHSEPIKNQSDLIRLILRHQSEWIRTNPKPSFQSRLIWINPSLDWSKPNFQSKSIEMNPRSDWFWLKIRFGSIRDQIDSDRSRLKTWFRIHSDWFLTDFHETRYETFFRLVQNNSHWLGYRFWNESEEFWLTRNEF